MNRAVRAAAVLAVSTFAVAAVRADTSHALTRDEVTVVKRKLQAIEAALGAPPQGYEKASENFNLPTNDNSADDVKRTYYPIDGSVNLKYDGGSAKLNQQTQTSMMDLQKQMSDAMAKGDYETVAKVQQQMMQQSNAVQSQAIQMSQKGTIEVSVQLNGNSGAGIDPDAVLFEKSGVLALKSADNDNPGQERVTVYVDPVGLKETKTLSTVTLRHDPTPRKIVAQNAVVELHGPAAVVEGWAKKIDAGAVLAQLDR